MKKLLEKVSLLSLSLMLVSTFSVSPALPKMLTYYEAQGYGVGQVELLFSLSSFAILGILLATPLMNRWLSERLTIILGLVLLAVGGMTPFFFQAYPMVFVSRIILGAGVGLINARAISIIGEHFSGRERVQMLGYRGSAEVLGSAVCTFLVGRLLKISWSASFLIYGLGFVILFLYLAFVAKPEDSQVQLPKTEPKTSRLSSGQVLYITGLALYAGFVILVNTAITLRLPLVMERLQLGTDSQSSLILSLMMLMGILAGALFAFLLDWLKDYLMALVVLALSAGLFILWFANSLWWLALGALMTGFVYSLGVTLVFHRISETIPLKQLNAATTVVLLGCNLGGGFASLVLQFFGLFSSSVNISFILFALVSLFLGLSLLLYQRLTHQ